MVDRGKTLFRVHGYTVVESEGNLHLAPIVYQITLITLISFISLLNTHTLWYIEDTHFLEVEYIYILLGTEPSFSQEQQVLFLNDQ